MEKKIYKSPAIRVYPSWAEFRRHLKMRVYIAPSIKMFESWKEHNLARMEEISEQQAKDFMQILVLVALWRTGFKPASSNVLAQLDDYQNGLVETLLSYEVGRFISSCLKKQRTCSFESLYNWSIQYGRSVNEVPFTIWKRNCGRACRKVWKSIPSSLKMGDKDNLLRFVYSTDLRNIKYAKEVLGERVRTLKKFRGKWAKKALENAESDYNMIF